MKTAKEIQNFIFDKTGIKTTARKLTGSMKGYVSFRPQLQGGIYPNYPYEFKGVIYSTFGQGEPHPTFFCGSSIDIFGIDMSEIENYKKERRPLTIAQMKVRQWGSKNSQLRLDKAAARYAKKVRRGDNIVGFY